MPTATTTRAPALRTVRHPADRRRVGVTRRLLATLTRLDDDPVLFCECAEGGPHTCDE